LTFKDLKKRVSPDTTSQQQSKLFGRLKNKPFWIWNIEETSKKTLKQREIAVLILLSVCPRKMVLISLFMIMRK
jgi:hypothetical protein